MHSNKALTSTTFQFINMTRSIFNAISNKPDDKPEWINILQLMCHLRDALSCTICGRLVSNPHTPIHTNREPCGHGVCANCRNEDITQIRHNCITCRDAFQATQEGGDGFEPNRELNSMALGFIDLCDLLVKKGIAHKWPDEQVDAQNGPITFGLLLQEDHSSDSIGSGPNLGDKFRKKVREKEHHCRCGSGARKSNGKKSGELTCRGQRCACYRLSKLKDNLKLSIFSSFS